MFSLGYEEKYHPLKARSEKQVPVGVGGGAGGGTGVADHLGEEKRLVSKVVSWQ